MKSEQEIRDVVAILKCAIEELSYDHVMFGANSHWESLRSICGALLWAIGDEQEDTSVLFAKVTYLLKLRRAGAIGDDWDKDRKHIGSIWPWPADGGRNGR